MLSLLAKSNPWQNQNVDGYENDVGYCQEGPSYDPWENQAVAGYEADLGLAPSRPPPFSPDTSGTERDDDTPLSWNSEPEELYPEPRSSPERQIPRRDGPAMNPWKNQNIHGTLVTFPDEKSRNDNVACASLTRVF